MLSNENLHPDQEKETKPSYPPYLVMVKQFFNVVRRDVPLPHKPDVDTIIQNSEAHGNIYSDISFADLRDKIRDQLMSTILHRTVQWNQMDASASVPVDDSFIHHALLIFSTGAGESRLIEAMRHVSIFSFSDEGAPAIVDDIRKWCDEIDLGAIDARVAERGLTPSTPTQRTVLCTNETDKALHADWTQEPPTYPPYWVHIMYRYDTVLHEAAHPYTAEDHPAPLRRSYMDLSVAAYSHLSFADLRDKIQQAFQGDNVVPACAMYETRATENIAVRNEFISRVTLVFSVGSTGSSTRIGTIELNPPVSGTGFLATDAAIRAYCNDIDLEALDAQVAERGLKPETKAAA